ncbi:putative methyltransferase [Gordonia araii NBRC 100433]|uniref:Putative methyltransferase n=1 Tax=Gordonia araii NBRC 100433 TaxID=1073574 RepID=G7H4Q9_9ACTN|nr:hypothetical protein [Gordonia araii]NNG98025.1 SAM-dependent methyltransferase [Gordonia araii NBRC 100433]GAB10834.1 putative methyltransferase [Gordonia araii NBRC 100433]
MSVDFDADALVGALRAAGCVFAEDEARILRHRAVGEGQLSEWLRRRIAGEPLEQIVGAVEFAGLDLAVGAGVFVPRQRTRLVAAIASDEVGAALAADPSGTVFVEPYCGAAPIAAHVARDHPAAAIVATDIDPVALAYAERNLSSPAIVRRGSGLAGLPQGLRGRVSVTAAVPPYVPDGELDLMPGEARGFEPVSSHSAGAAGLDEVSRLLREAREWLRPTGVVALELHRRQADAAARIAVDAGFQPTVRTSHRSFSDDGHTAVLLLRDPAGDEDVIDNMLTK